MKGVPNKTERQNRTFDTKLILYRLIHSLMNLFCKIIDLKALHMNDFLENLGREGKYSTA